MRGTTEEEIVCKPATPYVVDFVGHMQPRNPATQGHPHEQGVSGSILVADGGTPLGLITEAELLGCLV